jgi:hypothetical protein
MATPIGDKEDKIVIYDELATLSALFKKINIRQTKSASPKI